MGKKKNTPTLAKEPFEIALSILSEVQTPEELENAKQKITNTVKKVLRNISKKELRLA